METAQMAWPRTFQRHLDNEPVSARPPSNVYRFSKKLIGGIRARLPPQPGSRAILLVGLVVSMYFLLKESSAHRLALRQSNAPSRVNWLPRRRKSRAKAELWNSYLAQARASRLSGEPWTSFRGTDAITRAAAIRFAPELRDEAIACLALPDIKLKRRIEVHRGVFDGTLERLMRWCQQTWTTSASGETRDDKELLRLPNTAGTVKWLGRFRQRRKTAAGWVPRSLPACVGFEPASPNIDRSFDPTCDIDFAPDGQRGAVVSGQSEVSIYDLVTGRKLISSRLPLLPDGCATLPTVAESPFPLLLTNRLAILDASTGTSFIDAD